MRVEEEVAVVVVASGDVVVVVDVVGKIVSKSKPSFCLFPSLDGGMRLLLPVAESLDGLSIC
jgi:hypothetical protein